LRREAFESSELIKTEADLESFRLKYLGRKSALNQLLRSLKDLPEAERKQAAPAAQKLKKELEETVSFKKKEFLTEINESAVDITRPGLKPRPGHLHPLTQVEDEIKKIFSSLNFGIVEGSEIETERYNFDALNMPANHPAREMQDTFWLKERSKSGDERLLRTQTSAVQVRYMESHEPPFQIIAPGKVFRYEATDASHETNFYQVEGLMVGRNVNLANLKFIVSEFFKKLFGPDTEFRFRPSYFPFTEPSLEVDIRLKTDKKGNANLKTLAQSRRSEWLEVMGAGMVHPRVFEAAHYNPRDWQGFAFGVSLDRLTMIKYGIPDIRLFHSGDLRFINQF